MKTITTYMADDGKIFDNYDDCYEYELNQSLGSIDARIRMFDECLNPMTEKLTTANSDSILGRCAYIYLADQAAVNIMQDLYDQFGYIFPKSAGYWYYDYENDIWVSLTEKIEELRICEKEFKMMGGEL